MHSTKLKASRFQSPSRKLNLLQHCSKKLCHQMRIFFVKKMTKKNYKLLIFVHENTKQMQKKSLINDSKLTRHLDLFFGSLFFLNVEYFRHLSGRFRGTMLHRARCLCTSATYEFSYLTEESRLDKMATEIQPVAPISLGRRIPRVHTGIPATSELLWGM